MGRNHNERPESLKEKQRGQILYMYHELGMVQKEIGAELGISQSTVSREIRLMVKRYQKAANKKIEKIVNTLIADVALAKHEALQAWEKSKSTQVTARGIVDGDMPGDPRFLKEFREAALAIHKLIGAEDVNKLPLTPETIMIMQALGLSMSDLSRTFNEMIKQAAAETTPHPTLSPSQWGEEVSVENGHSEK